MELNKNNYVNNCTNEIAFDDYQKQISFLIES